MAKTKETKDSLTYLDSKESVTGKPILCKLFGPVADVIRPTRNGRKYSNELWEKVFKDPLVIEAFENGGILLEANHPTDRSETDLTRVAGIMPNVPVKNKDGLLEAYVDVLDTPCGNIIATLAKYGYKIGISSRGDGEIVEEYDGTESVNPDSFRLNAWDFVVTPAVKEARLTMVESVQGKTLKQTLNESLNKASKEDRAIMEETLDSLNIKYKPEKEIIENNVAANDVGADIVKELQESLLKQQAQESKIVELQEKLSVCYAKEAELEDQLLKYKTAIRNLSESVSNAKALKSINESLSNQLKEKDKALLEESNKFKRLIEEQKIELSHRHRLKESLNDKTREIEEANKTIKALKEDINKINKSFKEEIFKLEENFAEVEKDYKIKQTEYASKLSKLNSLVEKYRNTAKLAVDKYVESKSVMLGINKNEIFNKLPKNYSFNDIDMVCESLSRYKLTTNKLPFNLEKDKIVIKESMSINPNMPVSGFDDTVDEALLSLAKIK